MYDNKLYSLNPLYPEDPQYPYGERARTIMYRSSERCSEPSVLMRFRMRRTVAILRKLKAEELYAFEREDQ